MATTLSPNKNSPSQRLRLSSDISEEDFLLDFDKLCELNCDNDDRFLLLEFDPAKILGQALEWISVDSSSIEDDPYFHISIQNNYNSPVNGHNRFDYRTSISRTATITKRRVDETTAVPLCGTPMATDRFGTITKRFIHPNGLVTQSAGPINRTFEIIQNSTFDKSMSSFDRSPLVANGNFKSTPVMMNDIAQQQANINTNTITKNRRSFVVRPATRMADSSDTSDCITIASQNDVTSTDYETESTEFNDNENMLTLNKNGTFTKESSSDRDESLSSNTASPRNYPTISRNITKTLLKKESSQGQIIYTRRTNGQASNSNDDLLTSDSSEMSTQSNISMTSSISGRSEPNLLCLPNAMVMNGQSKLSRPTIVSNRNNITKLAKPTFANGPTSKKVMNSKLPNSMNGFGGSVGSLAQSNIGRASSQTMLTMANEMSSDREQYFYLNNDDATQKLLNGITRNTTFRIHRQQPIMNIMNVFNQKHQQQQQLQQQQPTTITNQTIKSNSDDNILHTDDRFAEREMKEFRSKVLNSNGYGSNRARNCDIIPANSRSDSPSSNSSCSSTSSMSKIPSFGSALSHYPRNGIISRGFPSRPNTNQLNNNNNNPNTLNDNLNNNTTNGSNRNGSNTNLIAGSRIPALPKALTLSSNRSNIPVSGIPQVGVGYNHEQSRTLPRKGKQLACQEPLSANNQFGDKSWQTDCF